MAIIFVFLYTWNAIYIDGPRRLPAEHTPACSVSQTSPYNEPQRIIRSCYLINYYVGQMLTDLQSNEIRNKTCVSNSVK